MCVMIVRDQPRQAFGTRFCPLRYRTSKFVHRPLKKTSLPIRAKYRHFRTICEELWTILQLIQFLLL